MHNIMLSMQQMPACTNITLHSHSHIANCTRLNWSRSGQNQIY